MRATIMLNDIGKPIGGSQRQHEYNPPIHSRHASFIQDIRERVFETSAQQQGTLCIKSPKYQELANKIVLGWLAGP